ncbi:DUF3099 domain-containing protein [Kitasatospora putterlickiae]|uniref:DUF3099 domain-containing protein n=1 Tax=Kitasatospora putterlickiae TaxID=221725 RepID=A0ABP4IS08_9ACTN
MGKSADGGRVYRITGARSSLSEDVRGRQRRYVASMLLRTVCVLLAVVLWDVQRWLAFAALAGGVLLPYFAVLLANAGRERAPGLPSTFDVPPTTQLMLGPGGAGPQGADVTQGADEAGRMPTDSSQGRS